MKDKVPLTKQLINDYEKTNASTLAVKEVPHEETSKYGIIAPKAEISKGLFDVQSFVEKPEPKDAPSDYAIIGRYLLKPEIFSILESQEAGAGGEIQLTDAINTLNQYQRVFARNYTGTRYDVGDKLGLIEANIEYGLKHKEISGELKKYITQLAARLNKA